MAQINELEELIRAVDRLTQSEKELAKVSGQISQLNDEIAVSEGEARESLLKKQDKLSDEQVLLNKKIKLQRQVVEEEKAAARAAGVSEKAIDRATKSTKELNGASELAARTLRQFGPVGRALATALELSRKSAGGLTVALKGVKTALVSSGIGLAIVAIGKAVEILSDKIKVWWKENHSLKQSQDDLNDSLEKASNRAKEYATRMEKAAAAAENAKEQLAAAEKELREFDMTDEQLLKQREADVLEYNKQINAAKKEVEDAERAAKQGEISYAEATEIQNEAYNKQTKAIRDLIKAKSDIERLNESIAKRMEREKKAIDEARIAYEKYAQAMREDIGKKAEEVTPQAPTTGRDEKAISSMLKSTAFLEGTTQKSLKQRLVDVSSEITATQNIMDSALIKDFESEAKYYEFMTQQQEKLTDLYSEQSNLRADITEREQQERIAIAQYGFDALNSVLDLAYADDEDKSRKAFERNKKLQYAQTLVNGASGSVAIWTDAQSGIKEKVAAQVALALSTAVALQQIARTRYDSGGMPETGQAQVGKSATELLQRSQTITSLQTQTQAAASQTVLVVSDVDYQQNFANSTRAKAVIS